MRRVGSITVLSYVLVAMSVQLAPTPALAQTTEEMIERLRRTPEPSPAVPPPSPPTAPPKADAAPSPDEVRRLREEAEAARSRAEAARTELRREKSDVDDVERRRLEAERLKAGEEFARGKRAPVKESATTRPPAPRPQQQGERSLDLEILFDYNSAAIAPQSLRLLADLGAALTSSALQGDAFRLVGHTDGKGTREFNQSLSERRAASVRDFMVVIFKVDPGRLTSAGAGMDQPKNRADLLASENRRVQIINTGAFDPAAARAGSASGPSFDCAATRDPVSQLICRDGSLSALDREMAGLWHTQLAQLAPHAANQMRMRQREWLSGHAACQGGADCLRERYRKRIDQLRSGAVVADAIATAGEPVLSPNAKK